LKTTYVIPSYHAPVGRHRQMKMAYPRLMVRQAHHERLGSRSSWACRMANGLFSEQGL